MVNRKTVKTQAEEFAFKYKAVRLIGSIAFAAGMENDLRIKPSKDAFMEKLHDAAFRSGKETYLFADGSILSIGGTGAVSSTAVTGYKAKLSNSRTATWDGKRWRVSVNLSIGYRNPVRAWDDDSYHQLLKDARKNTAAHASAEWLATICVQRHLHATKNPMLKTGIAEKDRAIAGILRSWDFGFLVKKAAS